VRPPAGERLRRPGRADVRVPVRGRPHPATDLMYRNELRADAELTAKRLSTGLKDIAPERIDARAGARHSAAHPLHDVAPAEQAAIVVVGSTHTGHLGRVVPGATAERLLHGSPC